MRQLDLDTHQKALKINIDPTIYGTFAEIGAGQEIARCFFRVGGAAGTVAKTISAYDMTFSDAIYGKSSRYVSRERLTAMLDHEYQLLVERLGAQRGDSTKFFVFADTVSARNYKGTNECHGWMGIRMQLTPNGPPNDIIMHLNMLDRENVAQQEALGVVGVNLIYGAFFSLENVEEFVSNLLDDLSPDRIEIDLLEVSGPNCAHIDNRTLAINLVQSDLADAVVFDANGTLKQPSAFIHKHPILIERGSFRALQRKRLSAVDTALEEFKRDLANQDREAVSLIEFSINPEREATSDAEALSRVDALLSLGHTVMVSRFVEFFAVTSYLRRYTSEPTAFVMGISTLVQIFHERFYGALQGRILEGLGRLFSIGVTLYVYPMSRQDFESHPSEAGIESHPWFPSSLDTVGLSNLQVSHPINHLFNYLIDCGYIKAVN